MEMKCIETTYILINRLFAIVKRPTVNSYYCRHCKQKTQTHRTDHTIFIMKKLYYTQASSKHNVTRMRDIWRTLGVSEKVPTLALQSAC